MTISVLIKHALTFLLFFTVSATCSRMKSEEELRKAPIYKDIHRSFVKYHEEYVKLAKSHNIAFTRTVTIGFANIDRNNVVGVCNYGKNFREIDIDIEYWKTHPHQRRTLIYHELTHCLCYRFHDYAKDEYYPIISIDDLFGILPSPLKPKMDGRFEDGCPLSVMYPYNLSIECSRAHWTHYLKEMFDRCQPY